MSDEEALAAEETKEAEEVEEEKDLEAKLKEAVEAEVEEIGSLRRKVTVIIPRSLLDEQTAEQYAELSRSALVPGFRKGRAPHRLLEKRFGKEVSVQLRSQMLGSGYLAAVGLKTVSDPMIWVGAKDGGEGEKRLVSPEEALEELVIPDAGDLRFACEVEIQPEFELPPLETIPLNKPKLGITVGDVREHVDRLRGLRGTFEPVEGKIKADDLVIGDVKMSVAGEVVRQEDNMQLAARGQSVFGIPLPELGQALVGKKAAETTGLEVDIPDDYDRAELRGKKAVFEVVIHENKRLVLPPLDEAFLSSIGFESEKDLKAWVKDDLESRLNETLQQGLRRQVYEHLMSHTKLDLPEGLSSRQTDRVVMRKVLELRRQGVPDAEINKHIDELRTSARDEAASRLKLNFIMERIAAERDVQVTEEEVNTQIAQIAARYKRRFDRVRDDLSKGDGLSSLYLHIRDEKIVDGLIAEAEITETEVPKKDPHQKAASKTKGAKKEAARKKPAKKKPKVAKSKD